MSHRNLASLHRQQAERYGPRTALRYRCHGIYRDVSWTRYLADTLACAASLIEAGIQPGDRVGLWSENRVEWLIADMAILAVAAVNVPAHAGLAPAQIRYQFEHAEVSWLFLSDASQLRRLQEYPGGLPRLKGVVVFGGSNSSDSIPWVRFLRDGTLATDRAAAELERRAARLGPDDLATIMYTSGTTGNPKGVMLTHGNLLSNAESVNKQAGITNANIILSWLPYSHIYARLVDHYENLAAGATLCLAQSVDTLVEDLREIRPTNFSSVPRFYEKVYNAVRSDDREQTRRRLRDVFGDRIEWLNSGGAPLPLHLAEAYVDAGLPMLQGYGLTESSPVITFNCRGHNTLGTVGRAVPGVEVRIAEDGEVLTRGPHVMRGYWKNPAATEEALRDGWLHTGDVGRLDDQGYLTITGRKKDLLVLSNGKKVVPTEIEGLLLADEYIDQVVVFGEGRNYLTALVVPQYTKLRDAVSIDGQASNEQLVSDPAVDAFMRQRIDEVLAHVSAWEKIQKFVLLPRPFTQEAEELTVSLKLRRGVILEKYRAQLGSLYC